LRRNDIDVFSRSHSLVLEDDVQSVDETGNETKNGQRDVDEQIDTAATFEEDSKRGKDDGEDDLADIGSGGRHCG